MNKNTKRVLSAITTASLAGVLGGVAPAVAPTVFNLNGGVVHAAEETHKVTIYYDLYDDPMSPFSSSSSSKVFYVTPNQPLSDHIPETLPGGYVYAGARANSGGSEGVSLRSLNDPFGNWTNFYVTYPKSKRSGANNNAGTEVKPNNDGNANAGANNDTSKAQATNQQAKKGSSTAASASGKVEAKKASNTAAGSDLPMLLAMVGSVLALFSTLFKKSAKEE